MLSRLVTSTMVIATLTHTIDVKAQEKLTREQQVLKDKRDFEQNKSWFYDDLNTGIKEARRSNRPMIIVFR